MSAPWLLAVDFGTTYTAAAVHSDGHTRMVALAADGAFRMPSAVWLDETGAILVGSGATEQAPLAPDRFERTPKRCLGDGTVLLGQASIDPTVLVSHLLAHVLEEAARLFNNTRPTAVVLTHPAAWAAARLDQLRSAARHAGLEQVSLLAEPVAAAIHLGTSVPIGEQVAVFDFGGGTLDVAVLRRTATGFDISGPPGGIDPLGGEDIDQHLLDHLVCSPAGQHPDWPNLLNPPDRTWRMKKAALRRDVRIAKEALSHRQSYQLFIPGLNQQIQLTRGELSDLIRHDVDSAVDMLDSAIQAAGQSPHTLARIFLVGGTSRIPLVADTIWHRLAKRPDTQDDPKSVVAQGAVTWLEQQLSPPIRQAGQERADQRKIPLRPGRKRPRKRRALLGTAAVLGLLAVAVFLLHKQPTPSLTAVSSISVGTSPFGVAVTPDGRRVYVTNEGSNSVSVIDTTTNTVLGYPIEVGTSPPDVVVSPDGRRAYVAIGSFGTVSVIDTTTNTLVGNPIPVGYKPVRVVVTHDGRRVYVTNGDSNTVSVIDTTTNTLVGNPIPVGASPDGIAASPDGRRIYVTNFGADTVSVIDTTTNTTIGDPIQVGTKPLDVVVTPDGRRAYVANGGSGSVSVIDTVTNTTVGKPIQAGTGPVGMAVAPDGRRIYIANRDSNTVSVLDTATHALVGTPIKVGTSPMRVAVTPDGRRLYVTNIGSNSVSVITLEPRS